MAAATLASAERRSASSWSTICCVADPVFSSAAFRCKSACALSRAASASRRLAFACSISVGFAGRQEIGELVAGLLQKPARLVDGGSIVGVVLIEQRLAFYDPVAARDVDGGDKALLGRTDLDEIRLGIALPGDRREAPWGGTTPIRTTSTIAASAAMTRIRRTKAAVTCARGSKRHSIGGLAGGHTRSGIST